MNAEINQQIDKKSFKHNNFDDFIAIRLAVLLGLRKLNHRARGSVALL